MENLGLHSIGGNTRLEKCTPSSRHVFSSSDFCRITVNKHSIKRAANAGRQAISPIHTADATNWWVESRRWCEHNLQLAHDECPWIRSTMCKLTKQTSWQFDYVNLIDTNTSLCRHLSPTSISQQHRKLSTGSRLTMGAFTPSTYRNRCWQICSDKSKLSATRCEFCTHYRHDSTRSRWCVLRDTIYLRL